MKRVESGSIVLFADREVGLEIAKFILESHPGDLGLIVTNGTNEISELADSYGVRTIDFARNSTAALIRVLAGTRIAFLAWWPYIVRREIFELPRLGTFNLHPSFLPHDRGKHYNFWTIVNDTPFGVTIHRVDDGIDTGAIIAQARLPKTWEDTGGTLYERAQSATVALFKACYRRIVDGDFEEREQVIDAGSFHLARELEQASAIDLERRYRARDLLNLLRARTFPGMPACHFSDQGRRYEVRVSISEVRDERE